MGLRRWCGLEYKASHLVQIPPFLSNIELFCLGIVIVIWSSVKNRSEFRLGAEVWGGLMIVWGKWGICLVVVKQSPTPPPPNPYHVDRNHHWRIEMVGIVAVVGILLGVGGGVAGILGQICETKQIGAGWVITHPHFRLHSLLKMPLSIPHPPVIVEILVNNLLLEGGCGEDTIHWVGDIILGVVHVGEDTSCCWDTKHKCRVGDISCV